MRGRRSQQVQSSHDFAVFPELYFFAVCLGFIFFLLYLSSVRASEGQKVFKQSKILLKSLPHSTGAGEERKMLCEGELLQPCISQLQTHPSKPRPALLLSYPKFKNENGSSAEPKKILSVSALSGATTCKHV